MLRKEFGHSAPSVNSVEILRESFEKRGITGVRLEVLEEVLKALPFTRASNGIRSYLDSLRGEPIGEEWIDAHDPQSLGARFGALLATGEKDEWPYEKEDERKRAGIHVAQKAFLALLRSDRVGIKYSDEQFAECVKTLEACVRDTNTVSGWHDDRMRNDYGLKIFSLDTEGLLKLATSMNTKNISSENG